MHGPRKIPGPVADGKIGEVLACFLVAGVGSRRDYAVPIGIALSKASDHLPQQVDLTHAYAMEPDARSIAIPQEGRSKELAQETAPVFPGSQGLVEKPG